MKLWAEIKSGLENLSGWELVIVDNTSKNPPKTNKQKNPNQHVGELLNHIFLGFNKPFHRGKNGAQQAGHWML